MTICLFKAITSFLLIVVAAQSCNTSTYYSRKRIKHHYADGIANVDTSLDKSISYNVTSASNKRSFDIDTTSTVLVNSKPSEIKLPFRKTQDRTSTAADFQTLKKRDTFSIAHPRIIQKKGTGTAILLVILILAVLVLAGFAMYWVGVWSFALSIALFWQILVFIGAVTLVSTVMGIMLYLIFLIAYSVGHASYKRPYYPGKQNSINHPSAKTINAISNPVRISYEDWVLILAIILALGILVLAGFCIFWAWGLTFALAMTMAYKVSLFILWVILILLVTASLLFLIFLYLRALARAWGAPP